MQCAEPARRSKDIVLGIAEGVGGKGRGGRTIREVGDFYEAVQLE